VINTLEFCLEVPLHTVGIFNTPQNLTKRERRLYFLSKEVVLRIFIALNNPSLSAGFEPANVGSSGKYDNH
jgi:hypothetical protein